MQQRTNLEQIMLDFSTIPTGICQCGCGKLTKIVMRARSSTGEIKGQPHRFVTGHHIRLRKSVQDRFGSKVRKADGDACWEWLASLNSNGYGQFMDMEKRRPIAASRVSWELTYGPIPAGLFVCHHCDNPPCVRPDHLFIGTARENTQDCLAKGRHNHGIVRGTDHRNAFLTPTLVRTLRARYHAGGVTYQQIADELGCSKATVSAAILGRLWSHVT